MARPGIEPGTRGFSVTYVKLNFLILLTNNRKMSVENPHKV
jgi:hypothetical protein